jgi:hypothetical protein
VRRPFACTLGLVELVMADRVDLFDSTYQHFSERVVEKP